MNDLSFLLFRISIRCVLLILVQNAFGQSEEKSEIIINGKQAYYYVDPFICTSNDHGQTDPSAGVPFGMVKPGPDTKPIAHSGYNYKAKHIIGFSNTRIPGVGCRGAGGNLRIFPAIKSDVSEKKLKSKYFKSSETAKPGYYSVVFKNGIKTELTSTAKVAFHQYSFPNNCKPALVIDLSSTFQGTFKGEHSITNKQLISGWVSSANVCNKGKYKYYFAIQANKLAQHIKKESSKIILSYNSNQQCILLKCALSVVSEQQAIENLGNSKNKSFEHVKEASRHKWIDMFNVVQVKSNNKSRKRIFYTHLYHALQTPFLISEENGRYRGSDGITYVNMQKPYYHGWSIWDTFRTKLPLFSLLYPNEYSNMMHSICTLYKLGKPNWATDTEPFITVRTEHSIITLLDAQKKDLLDYPLDNIYPMLIDEMNNLSFKSPDKVLESSYDLWAMSEIAKLLGKDSDAKKYLQQANEYKTTWKDKFLVMNSFSDVMHAGGLYEGTLWQYRWFVPFDTRGVQQLLGGIDNYERELDYFFNHHLFNMGNQPDIQTPYLYAYTNSPWKTQQLVNQILTKKTKHRYGTHNKRFIPKVRKAFTDTPDGYIKEMDDDAGTMSSWYLWSALGLYPICPGDENMVLNTPLFHKVIIKTSEKDLEIIAHGLSDEAIYIQSVSLNGEEVYGPFLNYHSIKNGGKLEFKMGKTPNKDWGILLHKGGE